MIFYVALAEYGSRFTDDVHGAKPYTKQYEF